MVKTKSGSTVAAGEFKAKCLRIMDEVSTTRRPVTITKKGKPIAKLVPVDGEPPSVFGCLRTEISIEGDILAPVVSPHDWKALR